MISDEIAPRGSIYLDYPFQPPGKPERLRTAHLEAIETPSLICQGTRDSFDNHADVAEYALAEQIQLHWPEDDDHGFKPRKKASVTESDNWLSTTTGCAQFIDSLI